MNKSAADFDYSAYNLAIRLEEHGSFKIFYVETSPISKIETQQTATKNL